MGVFEKKAWLARVGTGLNKFIDRVSGKTLQLESTPDSVAETGTPLSADVFNELENRIESAMDKKMGLRTDSAHYAPAGPDGEVLSWVRGGYEGILPYSPSTDGRGSVGSANWPFAAAHIKRLYGKADALTTPRSIGISGVTATQQNFDGTYNIAIPITHIPASLISGALGGNVTALFTNRTGGCIRNINTLNSGWGGVSSSDIRTLRE